MRAPSAARMRPQDGSPPKIPDLTRLPPATARARSRASVVIARPLDVDDQQLARALAVGGDRAREVVADLAQRRREALEIRALALDRPRARPPVGERDHAVVGRHVAVDGDGVEAVLDGRRQRRLQHAGRDRRVRGDEAEHGRHLRVDHPRALADGDDLDRLAVELDRARRHLGAQIGGPDRLGRGSGSVPSDDASAGIAARMRSTGSGEPMAPVDAVSTSSGVTPSAAAAAAATARSSTAPRGP